MTYLWNSLINVVPLHDFYIEPYKVSFYVTHNYSQNSFKAPPEFIFEYIG